MSRNSSSISSSSMLDIRKLVYKLLIFSLPFLSVMGVVAFVDPFDFFGKGRLLSDSEKHAIARDMNPCFWQLNKFDKNPTKNVLLGDSRMAPVKVESIKAVSNEDYSNLGFGGGSVREVIESFWIVSQRTKLKKVFIGINPEKYNDYEITNRVEFYKAAKENPSLYFVNRAVLEGTYYNIYQYVSGINPDISAPKMATDQFWKFSVDITRKYFSKFSEPKKYREELKKIADYCDQNDIELSFIIFPTHVIIQQMIVDENFTDHNIRMRKDFAELGDVYDFDWENDLTRGEGNFEDPLHVNKENMEIVVREIWGNDLKFGRLITRSK
jgi:hypothetical protein